MGTRHSVKNGTLGKIHRIRTNLVLFSVLPSAALGKTDRNSVLPSAALGKICPQNFFFVCFSAYPVTISNKITENYNNMTDRQYISHICPQMSHPLTITNICRQAPCKVHKHHQHMSKVHKVQPSPQFNIQNYQTRSDGLSHGRRPAEKRSQVQVLITLHIVVRSSCRRSLE